jgi:hypothetical protein
MKNRAEQYLTAITTLRELLLNVWKGIRDQNGRGTAIEKRPKCYGIAFLVALFHDMRGMMVLLTHCVLSDESFGK